MSMSLVADMLIGKRNKILRIRDFDVIELPKYVYAGILREAWFVFQKN